ncbi:class II fructose-1,6-bisphosphate aldolase [Candidatus Mycoplasma mahonii]|uniref:class II fructose-1,6-bisphosphate aldolase n=1 Tax=Candidatus Mycoplasma mahonii TaxID=3004105 RepID=UPI0026E9EC73|nr:class II fructose-1,6-bisphosphate aldolase [Candidatus Mycoplasma mahonii]WKX02455.1 class II fructose-1,6-bisphosphate aldolase [Candidatus Mycoplasma mahonii]
MAFVNAKEMIKKAYEGHYAIPHINTNNLEWTKAILLAAEEMKSPVIIGSSEGAVKYMGGFKTVKNLVKNLHDSMGITVPVAIHLDHGTFEGAKKALEAGYTSVMFDGSHFPIEENIEKTKTIIALAAKQDASVEVEVGTLAGEEDGVQGSGDVADPKEVKIMADLGVDMIAAGINNIHGPYPEGWEGLNLGVLSKLKVEAQRGLVLHGGTGIPSDQITKAISMGVAKINVNTELQLANAAAIREFVRSGKSDQGKNYDPRKLLAPGVDAMVQAVKDKITLFGSNNKT